MGLKDKILGFFSIKSIIFAEYKNGIMTIKYSDGSIDQYKGSCTVWHKLPYMKRAGTFREGMLSELWQYNKKWKGPYPTAHENSNSMNNSK